MLKASIIIGIVGGIIIPIYEHSAKGACWWVYNDWTHEFWNAPYYIILGEALICFVLLNTIALLYNTSDSYSENVENFAEVYGLSETDTDSYLYQN